MMDDHLRGMQTTLTTSTIFPTPTLAFISEQAQENIQALLASQASAFQEPANVDVVRLERSNESTVNGVVIGLLSSFGSAILIAIIFLIVYFFRYTNSGRILLDRIGRPGEYDDEQQYAREEAEALEEMDDLQRAEYLRAKGMLLICFITDACPSLKDVTDSLYPQRSYKQIHPIPYRPTYHYHSI